MRRKTIKIIIGTAVFLLIVVCMSVQPRAADNAAALLAQQDVLELDIDIKKPNEILTGEAEISIAVTVLSSNNGNRAEKTEARTDPNSDWIDISSDMKITVTKNCTVYVQVTDSIGNKYLKSRYIDSYDTEKPTVMAWTDNGMLHIEAGGSRSGIDVILINDWEFNGVIDNKLIVPLQDYVDSKTETINVIAVNKAGIKSDAYSVRNPLYNPSGNGTESRATQPPVTPEPTPAATPESTPPPTAGWHDVSTIPVDGSGSVLENNVKSSEEREFFTIETKNGNNFFIVIDREKNEKNVYLLVEAAERDLMGFVDTNTVAVTTPVPTQSAITTPTPEIIYVTPEPTGQPKPRATGVSAGSLILMLLVAAGAGGAGYYFKIYKPRNEDGGDDDDYYEEGDEKDYETEDSDYDVSEEEIE